MPKSTAKNPSRLYTTLFGLVRKHLWAPDGKPPVGWSEQREGSVLKRLLVHRSVSQIEVGIIGLALLRDSSQVNWLRPGEKVTCRALYNSRSGVSQIFELATRQYWLAAKKRPKRPAATSIRDILGDVVRHVERMQYLSLDDQERYHRYMRSPEWQAKRQQVLARASLRCERCDQVGGPLEVHHLRYTSLGFEPLTDLQALCLDCHGIADAERRGGK